MNSKSSNPTFERRTQQRRCVVADVSCALAQVQYGPSAFRDQ